MNNLYVLDACAMLAVLSDEPGAETVDTFYMKAAAGEIVLTMNKLNLLEVYYDLIRAYGKERADQFYMEVKRLPIGVYHEISDEVFMEAGRFKAAYRISLADSIALAQTLVSDGTLLTADHHDFDAIEKKEKIRFQWIR